MQKGHHQQVDTAMLYLEQQISELEKLNQNLQSEIDELKR
jgi:prefoldin subunit 5